MRFVCRLIILATALATHCLAADKTAKSPTAVFAWFDRLGFEDLSKAKFARIWTGNWTEHGIDNRLEQDVIHGFVLEDHGDTFRAVLADLSLSVFEKSGNDPSDREFCGYREQSLEQEANRLLKALKSRTYFQSLQEKAEHTHYDYFNRIQPPAQAFVVARACAQQGHKTLGYRLCTALAQHPTKDTLNHNPFPKWLEIDLSYAMGWRALIAFRDPACSWTDLRAQFQRILDQCPHSYWREHAEEELKKITSLLEGDKARKPLASDDPEELVWRLQDEVEERLTEEVNSADFWPRPYPFGPRKSTGVLAALRAMGKKAVPALLTELRRPPRLSRSASRYVSMGGGVRVSDTHWLALSVLEDIAGFQFRLLVEKEKHGQSDFLERDVAEDWWRAVQLGEERSWLQRQAKAGDAQASAVTDCLHARYPADDFEAATGAIRLSAKTAAPARWNELFDRLFALKDPRTKAFLQERWQYSSNNRVTILVAEALRGLGNSEPEQDMLESFSDFTRRDFTKAEREAAKDASAYETDKHYLIARFLMGTQSPKVLEAVFSRWPDMPPTFRVEVAKCLFLRIIHRALPFHP